MDVSSFPACDDKLDMIKTTSRIDSNLNAAMVDGRRFSAADHSGGPSRAKSNFVVVPRCRSKGNLGRSRDMCFSAAKRDDTTESRELPRDLRVPESPSPIRMQHRSKNHSPEGLGDRLHGRFCLQTLSTYEKHARKRTSSVSPPAYDSVGGKDVNPRKRTCETGDGNESSDNCSNKSVQYQNSSAPNNCSDGANILSKMYASFGYESSHTKNRYLSVSKVNPTVKAEPNFEEYSIPVKRMKRHCSNDLSNAAGSHNRKTSGSSPVHESRHSFDCRTPPPPQRNSSDRHSSAVRSHTSSQRKRLNERKNTDRHLIAKRCKQSSELIGNSRPHETNSPAEYTQASHQVSTEGVPSLPRCVDDSTRKSGMLRHTEGKHPYIADQTPESILQLPNYSLMHDQMNVMSPIGCNGIGYHHDPNLLLKSASLGAGSMNPFLLGVNACVMNPFLMSSLEQSEIMAAAAYRQAIAAQILKSRMAGVKPLLGLGLMDSSSSIYGGLSNIMYGFPEPAHLGNSIGNAFRFNSSDLPMNAHPAHKGTHAGLVKETRKRPHIHNQESPNSYHPDDIHSSRIDHEDEPMKSSPHGNILCESPRGLPSIKDTFRRLSQPAIPENSLDTDECDNYECTRIGNHKNSLSRTKVPSTDYGKKITIDHDIAATNSVKSPLELPHSVPAKPSDITQEDNTSLTDGKTFSRTSTYKNLTRERRLVANARERTRVHTISSAFEELRRQIPSYSCNQKLSKLAILRIACSYIQSLSVLAGRSTEGTFKEIVDQCTGVLQAESKARCRRKNTKAQVEWEMESYEKSTTTASARNGPDSTRSAASPHTLDYWQADRLVNGTMGVDSSSNDSDPSSPSPNGSAYAAVHHEYENNPHGRKHDETSSSIDETVDETISELSPINVDD